MPPDVEPIRQSLAGWFYNSLGITYALLIPGVALVCFVAALVVALRGKGPMAAAALVLFVPAPLFVGIFAAIQGGISMYQVIALSGATPKPAEVAAGISTALVAPLVAMALMTPTYAVATLIAVIRCQTQRQENLQPK